MSSAAAVEAAAAALHGARASGLGAPRLVARRSLWDDAAPPRAAYVPPRRRAPPPAPPTPPAPRPRSWALADAPPGAATLYVRPVADEVDELGLWRLFGVGCVGRGLAGAGA
jgi:hypothetical protein